MFSSLNVSSEHTVFFCFRWSTVGQGQMFRSCLLGRWKADGAPREGAGYFLCYFNKTTMHPFSNALPVWSQMARSLGGIHKGRTRNKHIIIIKSLAFYIEMFAHQNNRTSVLETLKWPACLFKNKKSNCISWQHFTAVCTPFSYLQIFNFILLWDDTNNNDPLTRWKVVCVQRI